MVPAPRPVEQRRRDAEQRLATDVDLWVATAFEDGTPYLVPLSFDWDGETILLATSLTSPTGRNLEASGQIRLGLGATRDVTIIDGDVETLPIDTLAADRGDRFAARTGFDPRRPDSPHRWFRVTPRRIQAWREENELADRDLMRDGRWLA